MIKKKTIQTEKAFEWLFERFSQPNLKPCQFDLDCLIQIANVINTAKQDAIKEDVLFAKLFCRVFLQEVEHFKDFKFAQKSIGEILEKPIEWHYENATKELNRMALNDHLQSLGIITDHFKHLTSEQEVNEQRILKENSKSIQIHVLGKLKAENVYKSLNNTITEFIFKFKNKP